MEVAAGLILLALIAMVVGALGRHDADTPVGQEIRAERSNLQNKAEDTGNGILVWLGLGLLVFVIVVLASGG